MHDAQTGFVTMSKPPPFEGREGFSMMEKPTNVRRFSRQKSSYLVKSVVQALNNRRSPQRFNTPKLQFKVVTYLGAILHPVRE